MADTPPDPAKARFLMIQLMRLGGLLMVLGAILILADKIPGPVPLGIGLLLFGLFEFLIMPIMLARRWKTPRK